MDELISIRAPKGKVSVKNEQAASVTVAVSWFKAFAVVDSESNMRYEQSWVYRLAYLGAGARTSEE